MSTSDPETSSSNDHKPPLRDYEFLTYEQLMDRLPDNTSREAVRKLVKERGLMIHRIGLHRMIYVRELIAASASGPDENED